MLERIAGNRELKQDLKRALGSGRIAHSILLVGEPGCGAGFAARCLAADYLYPNGGPHAEAVLRGQDTESIVVRGEGASGQIKVEAIRDARQNIQKSALSSDAEGRVLFIYGAQISANIIREVLRLRRARRLFDGQSIPLFAVADKKDGQEICQSTVARRAENGSARSFFRNGSPWASICGTYSKGERRCW